MAKTFMVLICVCIGLAQALNDEQIEMFTKMHGDCVSETGVDDDAAMKTFSGTFAAVPNLDSYLFCMFKKSGYLNDAGDFQVDAMRATLSAIHSPAIAENIIGNCIVKLDTALDTSLAFAKCYHMHEN